MSINDVYNNLKYDMNIIEKTILENIKETITKLKPNNLHELFYIYCYLLMKGYFSKNKYYEYNDINEDFVVDYRIFFEFGVYDGEGVCSHNSYHLNKFLKYLGLNSNFIGLEVKKIDTENIMDFTPNINKNLKKVSNTDGEINHASVLINTIDSNFILDPTNLTEIEILKNKEIFCPLGEYSVNKSLLKKHLSEYKFNEYSTISKELLIEYYKVAREKILKHKQLIENMYNKNEENYKEISKKLEYFKI